MYFFNKHHIRTSIWLLCVPALDLTLECRLFYGTPDRCSYSRKLSSFACLYLRLHVSSVLRYITVLVPKRTSKNNNKQLFKLSNVLTRQKIQVEQAA